MASTSGERHDGKRSSSDEEILWKLGLVWICLEQKEKNAILRLTRTFMVGREPFQDFYTEKKVGLSFFFHILENEIKHLVCRFTRMRHAEKTFDKAQGFRVGYT